MEFDKFTDRTRGFIQSAQTLALRMNHQQLTPLHLLKVLLDDKEGLASGLIREAGGDPAPAFAAVEAGLQKLPKVEGGGAGQIYLASETARLFDQAQQIAEKAGDSFVTAEILLLALAMAQGTEAAEAIGRSGIAAQDINRAIKSLRKGRKADSAGAEDKYEALKKYTRDLTQAVLDGKLDPVIGRDEEIRRTMQVLSRRTKNESGTDRRAWCRQDRDRGGIGAAHRKGGRSGGPEEQAPAVSRSRRADRGLEVPR